jgi:FkbM family methyltransferase
MGLKSGIIRFLEKLMKVRIYRSTPRGLDQFSDIRSAFPEFTPLTVFDIGANVGQSAETMLVEFPSSSLFCFEPSQSTFKELQERFRVSTRVQCVNLALSNGERSAKLELNESSVLRRLVGEPNSAGNPTKTEDVSLTTIDAFCAEQQITTIDYLKIDTEGHELQVLAGAELMLNSERIRLIELELGMNPENSYHTKFEDAKELMEQKGYRVFSITEQVAEWPSRQQHLRRVNAVFACSSMISK